VEHDGLQGGRHDITVLPIPSAGGQEAKPFVGVQGAFISAKTKNAVLANEFVVNYLTTEAVQDALYSTGGRVPALKASAAKVNDPILAGFNEAGATGAPMPSIPEMGSVWGFWGTTEVQIIGGQAADPAAAWTTMVDNITAAIKG
jgi:arabinogalactan oligomer/maltooligosaccharide transport system substrate-binding protein